MAYDTEPTAKYVEKFAKGRITYYSPQQADDAKDIKLIDNNDRMDVPEPASQAGKVQIKPLRTGKAAMIIDLDAATICQDPVTRVNPLDPADIESRRHADQLLEPFFAGMWEQSQVGNVHYSACYDLIATGRSWTNLFPLPRLWAGKEFQKLSDDLAACVDARADEDDPEEQKALDKKKKAIQYDIDSYLCENLPIRWRYMDSTTVWPLRSDERHLPEVVEVKKMTRTEIAAEYEKDADGGAMPECREDDQTEEDVYSYHNWYWTATAIMWNGTPILVHKWKHNLGMNPCLLTEAFTRRDKRRPWKSRVHDYADMLETENSMYSALRHSVSRNALAGIHMKVDTRARGLEEDAKSAGGVGNKISITPGEPVFTHLEEELGLVPSPGVTQELLHLLDRTSANNNEMALNPTLRGSTKSGESAIGHSTAIQQAQVPLGPYEKALAKTAKQWMKLVMKSVVRLNEEFPEAADKVSVTPYARWLGARGGRTVSVGPNDVIGWYESGAPRISTLLAVSRNAQMALATTAQNLPLHPVRILEEYLNFENAEQEVDYWMEWQIQQGLLQQLIALTQQKAGAVEAEGGDLQKLAQNMANLPADGQAALQSVLTPPEGQLNGQSTANTMQTGVMQPALSETAAQEALV